ncbi:hypothetical protein M433DRAFT_135563 [Acidomyces richmondensis BFW]|nr:hypothetical protein M433DRAFT_135563 [Acidomyces richmondensis BFW]
MRQSSESFHEHVRDRGSLRGAQMMIFHSGSPVAFGGSAYFTVGVAGMISSMWRMHGDDSWSRHGAAHGDGREKWHVMVGRANGRLIPRRDGECTQSRADKTCSDVHVQGSSGWEEESNESGVAMMEKDLGSEVIHLSSGEDVYLARARDLAKNADGSRSLSSLEADDRPSAVNGQGGDSPQYVNESPGWPKAVGLLRRRLRALDRVRFLRDVTPTWVRTGSRAVACRDEWMWRARRRRVRIDGKFEKSSEAHTDDATRVSSQQPGSTSRQQILFIDTILRHASRRAPGQFFNTHSPKSRVVSTFTLSGCATEHYQMQDLQYAIPVKLRILSVEVNDDVWYK